MTWNKQSKILKVYKYDRYNKKPKKQTEFQFYEMDKVSKHLKDDIKIKREVDGKIDLYSDCFNCNFERFIAINKEELSGLFEISIYM